MSDDTSNLRHDDVLTKAPSKSEYAKVPVDVEAELDKKWLDPYKEVFETILAKLSAETLFRAGRTIDTWILEERGCVHREVNRLRALLAHSPISVADVERAERLALGHSDYVRKYAHAAADLVFTEKPWA